MHDEVDLRGARAAGRRQWLHHEAGGNRESPGRRAADPGKQVYVSDRMANSCFSNTSAVTLARRTPPIADLSDRELEVFRLIGEGHGTRRIAEELHLSVKTVESYQAHIKDKLSLKSGRELVQRAIQWSTSEHVA